MTDTHPSPAPNAARSAAWSRYWEHGFEHSLPGTLDLDAEGPVRAFWLDAFACATGGRILDIGTGNGALPRLAMSRNPEGPLRIDAVDLADIVPARREEAGGTSCTFHPRTTAESLPFADGSFDLVVSQYAIEYMQLGQALQEAARVMAEGARLAFLMHATHSILAEVAGEEAAHAAWLLEAEGFCARLQSMLGSMEPGADPAAAQARAKAFLASVTELENRIRLGRVPELLVESHASAKEALRLCATQRHDEATRLVASQVTRVEDARIRASELCEAAVDSRRLEQITGRLVALGIRDIESGPIHHANGALLGVTLTGTKARR